MMSHPVHAAAKARPAAPRALLPAICGAAFVVFAQTFMVAPLIPHLSAVFASPITWVALAIPAYIVPQGLMTLFAGPLSDRIGRREVIYASLLLFVILLSLGFDLTHPQLAAIATDLHGPRGQAVALMAFSLFVGFGLGSLLFQAVLTEGFVVALWIFGGCALVAAGIALVVFRDERPTQAKLQAPPECP